MFVFWPDFLFVCPCRRTAPATARARTTSSSSRRETTWAWPSSPCSAASGPWESRRSTSRRGWGRMHTHTVSQLNDAAAVLSRSTIFSWIPQHTRAHTHTHTQKKNMHIRSSGDSSPECWGLSRIKIKKGLTADSLTANARPLLTEPAFNNSRPICNGCLMLCKQVESLLWGRAHKSLFPRHYL